MNLPNVKELEKLLKMCRRQGVTKLSLGDMHLELGDLPEEKSDSEDEVEATIGITDEQLAYYSALPDPLEERLNKQ